MQTETITSEIGKKMKNKANESMFRRMVTTTSENINKIKNTVKESLFMQTEKSMKAYMNMVSLRDKTDNQMH